MKGLNQVCTELQSQELKELGITAPSMLVFVGNGVTTSHIELNHNQNYFLPAWSVAELGEMLPNESGVMATSSYYNDHMGVWYAELREWDEEEDDEGAILKHESEGDTEAEARADLLIQLLIMDKVKAADCNSVLKSA